MNDLAGGLQARKVGKVTGGHHSTTERRVSSTVTTRPGVNGTKIVTFTYNIPNFEPVVCGNRRKRGALGRKQGEGHPGRPKRSTRRIARKSVVAGRMDERTKLRSDFEQLQREYKNMEAMRKVGPP